MMNSIKSSVNDNDSRVTSLESSVTDNDSRVTSLESSVTSLSQDFSGYSSGFSTIGSPNNVVVLARFDQGTLNTFYSLRIFFENSSENMRINGVEVVRQFMADYSSVNVDSLDQVTNIYRWRESPDNEDDYFNGSTYTALVEEANFDLLSLAKIVFDDTNHDTSNCGTDTTGITSICFITNRDNLTSVIENTYDSAKIRSLAGPMAINGLNFDAVRFESFTSSQSFRIKAKGVGLIFNENSFGKLQIIYYQVNGTSGGSLAGTPFDSGGALEGLLF
jgi:hypothetical protein